MAEIDASGKRLRPDEQFTDDVYSSTMPALAWTESDLIVTWVDDRDGTSPVSGGSGEVYFRRLFCRDCDDADPRSHPGAVELPGDLIDQSCDGSLEPCDPQRVWRNPGEFVTCVQTACSALVRDGELSSRECGAVVSGAARRKVGGRR